MGYLLSLLSAFCFGITNCLWIFPQKKQHFIHVIIFRSFVTVILFGITTFFFQLNKSYLMKDLIVAVFISLFSCLGLFFYTKSLKVTTVAVAVPISAINSFFGVLVGVIIFKDDLPRLFFFIAIGLITGLFLIEAKTNSKLLPLTKGTCYNLLAAVCWGITFGLFKIPVEKLGVWNFSFILELSVLLFSSFLAFTTYKMHKFQRRIISQNFKWYLVLGLLAFIAVASHNLALKYIEVSKVSMFGNLTPLISIMLSLLLFKQTISKRQIIGIIILVVMLLLLGFKTLVV